MKKRFLMIIILALFVGFISVNAKAGVVATFDDPAIDGTTPLFTVDFTGMTLNGGWANGNTGLTLQIPYSGYTVENGNAFQDAWFVVTGKDSTEVKIVDASSGDTEGGEINFYAYGTTTDPLLTISFESGHVDYGNFGADEFFSENVTITGSEITGALSGEEFSFGFANTTALPGSNDGFTATAAFTSSAVPEPATVALLGLGALSLLRRKRNV